MTIIRLLTLGFYEISRGTYKLALILMVIKTIKIINI